MSVENSITSANSIYVLDVGNAFTGPQVLQGYATDDAFTSPSVEPTEIRMGVDGIMSAGFAPYPVKTSISFQADSDSIQLFDVWAEYIRSTREICWASCTIILPSVGKMYTGYHGTLTGYKPTSDAKKLLEAVTYEITWQSLTPSNI